MYCRKCGKENPEVAKFCGGCGASLTGLVETVPLVSSQAICPNCHAPVKSDDSFCEKCGTSTDSHAAGAYSPTDTQKCSASNASYQKVEKAPEKSPYKSLKTAGICFIILGIVLGLVGYYASGSLSNSYKGVKVTTGYYANGVYKDLDTITMGGNQEAVDYFSSLQIFMLIGGGIIALLGVVNLILGIQKSNIPIVSKYGTIVDCYTPSKAVVVAFDDGTKKQLTWKNQTFVMAAGDYGLVAAQDAMLVDFTRHIK